MGPSCSSHYSARKGKGFGSSAIRMSFLPPETVAGVYYLQRFPSLRGAQIFVTSDSSSTRGRVIAAMMRTHSSWITNIKQGGRPSAVTPDAAMAALAIRAAEAVGAAIAGVDIWVGDGWGAVCPRGEQHAGMEWAPEGDGSQYCRAYRGQPHRGACFSRPKPDRFVKILPKEAAEAFLWACLAELEAPKAATSITLRRVTE